MINGRNLCNSIITPPGGIGTRALENAQTDLIESIVFFKSASCSSPPLAVINLSKKRR